MNLVSCKNVEKRTETNESIVQWRYLIGRSLLRISSTDSKSRTTLKCAGDSATGLSRSIAFILLFSRIKTEITSG